MSNPQRNEIEPEIKLIKRERNLLQDNFKKNKERQNQFQNELKQVRKRQNRLKQIVKMKNFSQTLKNAKYIAKYIVDQKRGKSVEENRTNQNRDKTTE